MSSFVHALTRLVAVAEVPETSSDAKTPYDRLCVSIANDDELFEHVIHYVAGDPEALNDYPDLTRKLEGLLSELAPFKPVMSRVFYRGESEYRRYSKPRQVESWTPNKEVALDFAKNVSDPAVRRIYPPIQGVQVADLGYWRSRLRPDFKYYGDSQAEWLILRPKKVDTVYTKEGGWVGKDA
jgi:hypothetical protein